MVSALRSDGRPADDVETYVFENGGVTIVDLEKLRWYGE